WGDPTSLPHPIVWFGNAISFIEKRWNKGCNRKIKGAISSIFLIIASGLIALLIYVGLYSIHWILALLFTSIGTFYCLAGKTLIDEVTMVFYAVDHSIEDGRKQVGRIVGRDTNNLSAQEVRAAALETLAENLSDGVIAPLFWYLCLGLPGIVMYKMINTLDSMIGYRNDRYKDYGCWAAHIDDIANYLPARITAFLMLAVCNKLKLLSFVWKYGKAHLSPNSGFPEAALAGILNCRFGGTHNYFGVEVYKPYIGENERPLSTTDMIISTRINKRVELVFVLFMVGALCLLQHLFI
ncbi:MAG: adenosylcobinamide-phosphate synthase CbiB, partial [Phocaeicola sp.]|nr:adenosylcobinamide-phosphate synthase CbiB [Phocaeicola sp.]